MRGALLELKAMHRMPGPWLPLALGVWVLIVWIQEPAFLRRSGVPFFWDSVGAALSLSLLLLPLVWLLGRSDGETVLRAVRRPSRAVIISTLSIVIYGLEVAVGVGLVGSLLDLSAGRPDLEAVWSHGLRAMSLLLPLASLAPGLAFLHLSAQGTATCWLVLAGSYSLLLGAGMDTAAPMGPQVLSVAMATAAGLMLSTAMVRRRITG